MNKLSPESRVNSTSPQRCSPFDSTIQQISSSSVRQIGEKYFYWFADLWKTWFVFFKTWNHICSWLIKVDVSTGEESPTGPGSHRKPQLPSGAGVCRLIALENSTALWAYNTQSLPAVGARGNSRNIPRYSSPLFFIANKLINICDRCLFCIILHLLELLERVTQ